MKKRPVVKDQKVAVALGVACMAGAAFFFFDAYERRNKPRPPLVRWAGI